MADGRAAKRARAEEAGVAQPAGPRADAAEPSAVVDAAVSETPPSKRPSIKAALLRAKGYTVVRDLLTAAEVSQLVTVAAAAAPATDLRHQLVALRRETARYRICSIAPTVAAGV